MADGSFRRKNGYTIVQNSIARDKNISMKAKGLYLIIQSYITMPDKEWHKNDFTNMVAEGKAAFDSAWKELKDAGYLKVYIYSYGKGTRREYELLDEAKEGRSDIYVKSTSDEDTSETIENKGFVQLPENQVPGNQVPGIQGLGNQEHGNHEPGNQGLGNRDSGKDINTEDINKDLFNKTINNKPFENNPLLPQTESLTSDVAEEDEEERVKNQINYSKLVYKHQGNKELLAYILLQMKEMLYETKSRIEISSGKYEDRDVVRERVGKITYEDIENLLQTLPDKKENNVRNPKGYIRMCLFNLADRRGAICATEQIKGRNGGSEYDFSQYLMN